MLKVGERKTFIKLLSLCTWKLEYFLSNELKFLSTNKVMLSALNKSMAKNIFYVESVTFVEMFLIESEKCVQRF